MPKWKRIHEREHRMEVKTRALTICLIVHRHIAYPPHVWLGSCHALDLHHVELQAVRIGEAKQEFFEHVADAVASLHAALFGTIP